jgi:hypothetical protein
VTTDRPVQPQATPNPNAMRFAFQADVLGGTSRSFMNAAAASKIQWAAQLFAIPGVVGVFGLRDFLTVTKSSGASWPAIVPKVVEVLRKADLSR